jgi:hypothetical protein
MQQHPDHTAFVAATTGVPGAAGQGVAAIVRTALVPHVRVWTVAGADSPFQAVWLLVQACVCGAFRATCCWQGPTSLPPPINGISVLLASHDDSLQDFFDELTLAQQHEEQVCLLGDVNALIGNALPL